MTKFDDALKTAKTFNLSATAGKSKHGLNMTQKEWSKTMAAISKPVRTITKKHGVKVATDHGDFRTHYNFMVTGVSLDVLDKLIKDLTKNVHKEFNYLKFQKVSARGIIGATFSVEDFA